MRDQFELHVVSTGKGEQQTILTVAKEIWTQVDYIHIREKSLSLHDRMRWANLMVNVGVSPTCIVVNNADPFHFSCNYGGVHWGQDMLQNYRREAPHYTKGVNHQLRLGVSVHSLEEAIMAEQYGADYVFFGHVYESNSKPGMEPRGIEALAKVCSSVSVTVIAIGGITPGHVQEIHSAGAKGIAVISSIWADDNPVQAALLFRQSIEALNKHTSD